MKHSPYLSANDASELDWKIGLTQDFPKPGVLFRNVNPLLRDRYAFRRLVDALCAPYTNERMNRAYGAPPVPNIIVALDARGFLFGGAMARVLDCALVPARKAGKLPGQTVRQEYGLEYGTAT